MVKVFIDPVTVSKIRFITGPGHRRGCPDPEGLAEYVGLVPESVTALAADTRGMPGASESSDLGELWTQMATNDVVRAHNSPRLAFSDASRFILGWIQGAAFRFGDCIQSHKRCSIFCGRGK